MPKALLVIDMQEATVGKAHADYFRYDGLLERVNQVIRATDADLVVYIRNLMKNNLINRLAPVRAFDGEPAAELAKGLERVSDHVFGKYSGDAFTVPELDELLKSAGVDTLELIGADGGGCVALTAIGACKKGYQVIINTAAVGTMFEQKREKYYKQLEGMGAKFI